MDGVILTNECLFATIHYISFVLSKSQARLLFKVISYIFAVGLTKYSGR